MAKFKKNKKLQGTPVGKAKNQKNKVVSKIKKKAIANGRNNVGDARNVLHAKSRRQMLTGGKNNLDVNLYTYCEIVWTFN